MKIRKEKTMFDIIINVAEIIAYSVIIILLVRERKRK